MTGYHLSNRASDRWVIFTVDPCVPHIYLFIHSKMTKDRMVTNMSTTVQKKHTKRQSIYARTKESNNFTNKRNRKITISSDEAEF